MSRIERYEVNLRSHLVNLSGLLIQLSLTGGFLWVMNFWYHKGDSEYLFGLNCLFGGFSAVQVLLSVPIHLNYFSVNRADCLFYQKDSNTFVFEKGDKRVSFGNNDIVSVDFYRDSSSKHKGIEYLASDSYSHIIVHLQNGISIIITSLLIGGDIELLTIDEGKVRNKIHFFRWVRSSSSLILPSDTCI